MLVYSDLETYSECPISRGAYRYAEDPSTEVLLWGYAVDDQPARVWDVTAGPMPEDLRVALKEVLACQASIVWHNGMNFDTNVLALNKNGVKVAIPRSQIIDTMVIAYQHGLPGALGDLCEVYRMPKDVAKDKDGRRLVQLFCKPHAYGHDDPTAMRFTKKERPEDWERFVNYCRLDVEAERALYKKLPRFNLTEAEHHLQLLDDEINHRGMLMDVDLARAAIDLMAEGAKKSRLRTAELTGGELDSTTRTQATIDYLAKRFGIELKNLQKAEVSRLIEDDSIPEPMRELLRIRLSSAKASVKKYQAILDCVNSDNRLRGGLQFRGASRTGRFSGRHMQPQNLPRQTLSPKQIEERIEETLDGSLLDFSSDPAGELAQCLRGAITVPKGSKMVVADYSNIEGRVLAWMAGEDWKLKAFRAYDAGTGPDLYKLTYSRAFNVPVETVTKAQRQMGKVLELAMGYGGGVGAFVTFARGYGVDLNDMAEGLKGVIPPEVTHDAERLYEWAVVDNKRTGGLSHGVWVACDSVKRLWRAANAGIVSLWGAAGEACLTAVKEKGVRVPIALGGKVYAVMRGSWLLVHLPSGRFICYPAARIDESGASITYMGVNQYTRKWGRIETFAGKAVENLTQAVACDVLCYALPIVSDAGYKPILTVHDEILTEAPDTPEFNHKKLEALMSTNPPWAMGLPLSADGFDSYRYHK